MALGVDHGEYENAAQYGKQQIVERRQHPDDFHCFLLLKRMVSVLSVLTEVMAKLLGAEARSKNIPPDFPSTEARPLPGRSQRILIPQSASVWPATAPLYERSE